MFNLKQIISSIADAGQKLFSIKNIKKNDLESIISLCDDLISHKGAAFGITVARDVTELYESLSLENKLLFFLKQRSKEIIILTAIRNKDLVALKAFFSSENGIGWIIPPIWLISLNIILVFSIKNSNSFPKNKAEKIQERIIENKIIKTVLNSLLINKKTIIEIIIKFVIIPLSTLKNIDKQLKGPKNIIDVLENRSCFIINWKKISKDKMTGISLYNKGPTWEW